MYSAGRWRLRRLEERRQTEITKPEGARAAVYSMVVWPQVTTACRGFGDVTASWVHFLCTSPLWPPSYHVSTPAELSVFCLASFLWNLPGFPCRCFLAVLFHRPHLSAPCGPCHIPPASGGCSVRVAHICGCISTWGPIPFSKTPLKVPGLSPGILLSFLPTGSL